MADGLNKVILLGNLGANPELKATSGGDSVLKMRLATSKTYLDRNKVKQERTEWHNVTVWGKRAEGLGKFLAKGMRLLVEGEIRNSSYDDNDGVKRYRSEVNAHNIIVASSKGAVDRATEDDYAGAPPLSDVESGADDTIPF